MAMVRIIQTGISRIIIRSEVNISNNLLMIVSILLGYIGKNITGGWYIVNPHIENRGKFD